jgi:DNA primase
MINVQTFLDKCEIPYKASGNNIGKNFLGLPVCSNCGDTRSHMGVNKFTGLCSCFICNHKLNIYEYVKWYNEKYIKLANKDIYTYFKDAKLDYDFKQQAQTETSLKFPFEMLDSLQDIHKDYLRKRNFDPEFLELRRDLRAFGFLNKHWQYRIIIPIYINGIIVSYVGRSIFKNIEPRYKNANTDNSIIPVKQCLYGIDEIGSHAVLIEGITDVWNFGSGGVATLGVEVTNKQINTLIKQGVSKVTVLFDPDSPGKNASYEVAKKLALFPLDISIYLWHKEDVVDVGDSSREKIECIREEIFS